MQRVSACRPLLWVISVLRCRFLSSLYRLKKHLRALAMMTMLIRLNRLRTRTHASKSSHLDDGMHRGKDSLSVMANANHFWICYSWLSQAANSESEQIFFSYSYFNIGDRRSVLRSSRQCNVKCEITYSSLVSLTY